MEREEFLKQLQSLEDSYASLKPELELTIRDPSIGLEGFVVVSTTLPSIGGPLERCGKGGTRITPTLTLGEVRMLAEIMALKNAATGLPLGGAKSGIRANPHAPDFEKKYRRFVQLVRPILFEHGGIFGGFGFDIGGKPEQALWACDELKSTRSFTGKPVEMGGTDYDREGIAGLGVATAAKTVLDLHQTKRGHLSFAIQGMGAMGAAVLRYFDAGGIVVISDPRIGGTFKIDAMPTDLRETLARGDLDAAKRMIEARRFERRPLEDLITAGVDVLFPCATQDVITESNADRINARFIIEGANNPCSAAARKRLFERGVVVVPDFIANPGGIIAAFVELTSPVTPEENARTRKNVEEAKNLTISKISENVQAMFDISHQHRIDPQFAARYLALRRIFP